MLLLVRTRAWARTSRSSGQGGGVGWGGVCLAFLPVTPTMKAPREPPKARQQSYRKSQTEIPRGVFLEEDSSLYFGTGRGEALPTAEAARTATAQENPFPTSNTTLSIR